MKIIKILSFVFFTSLLSCNSVKVLADYDAKTDFTQFKTFAFYKKGIDKAGISDIDKRRIMHAIESELVAKGLTKSTQPDVLISLFTKSRKRVDVHNTGNSFRSYRGYYYPRYYGANPIHISKYTEGTLFIDVIDTNKKQLVWQGIGSGYLSAKNITKKEARIKEFVAEIMEKYPIVSQVK